MPRPNGLASATRAIGATPYSNLADRILDREGEVYPFHVGDTWLAPVEEAQMERLRTAENPGLHNYSPCEGIRPLIEHLAMEKTRRLGIPVQPTQIIVTAGATVALGCWAASVVEPGEEVLILAPHWPLIAGIVRAFRGRPVLVGIDDWSDPCSTITRLEEATGSRTVALYLSSPNNPTGRSLPPEWLAEAVSWAAEKGLWIVSDEVYEDYDYTGRHQPVLPLAPERTVSVHSFSKALGMAGNRCGYLVGPEELITEAAKIGTHTYYCAPTASQVAALRILRSGDAAAWIAAARQQYEELGREAAQAIGIEPPSGSTFLFPDVAAVLDDRGLQGFLEDCADAGVLLAPGTSFGPYPTHVRLCYTATNPDQTRRGLDVLQKILSSKGGLA